MILCDLIIFFDFYADIIKE
jgi:hypothetical protein